MIPLLSNQLCHHPSLSALMEETWGVLEAQAIRLAGVMSSSPPNLFCLCCCEDRMCKIWIASTIGAQQFIKQMLTFHSEHFISLQSTVIKKSSDRLLQWSVLRRVFRLCYQRSDVGSWSIPSLGERRWGGWHLLRACTCHRLGTPVSSILTMLLCAGYGDLHCTGEEAEPPTCHSYRFCMFTAGLRVCSVWPLIG